MGAREGKLGRAGSNEGFDSTEKEGSNSHQAGQIYVDGSKKNQNLFWWYHECSEEGRSLDEEIGLNRDGRPPRYRELKSRDRFSRVSRLGENILGGIRDELQGSRALSRAEVSESEGA